MTTFDSWEVAVRPPEDYLMHFRTKGSKNGVRRFQREDGTWTELGLEERREREGWGDGESKKARKLEKKIARAEKKQARKEARAKRQFERSEEKRKRSLKGLTDEEMKQKLARAKMEAEYRDLTKKTSLIETGAKMVSRYLEYRTKREENALENNRQKLEMERFKTQQIQARENTKQSKNKISTMKYESKKAEQEAKKQEQQTKEAQINRKKNLLDAKREYKNYTIRGGIARAINIGLTAGKAKKLEAIRKAKGETKANRVKSDGARDLKLRRKEQERKDTAPERKRAEKMYSDIRKQQEKNRKEYERELKKHMKGVNKQTFRKY